MSLGRIIGKCEERSPRTGIGNCERKEKNTNNLIITAYNAYYPLDEKEFNEGLEGWVSDTSNLRMYPIKGVFSADATGGEVNTVDTGAYGPSRSTGLTAFSQNFFVDGGDCLYKELTGFNGRKMRLFRVDEEGYVYGTVVKRGGVDYFAGFEVDLYAYKVHPNGDTLYELRLQASYGVNNEKEEKNMNAFYIESFPEGLLYVILEKGSTSGRAKVVASCGGEDYTQQYGSQWTSTLLINSSGASPESVSYDDDKNELVIEPTGSYRVVDSAKLTKAGILGIDGYPQYTAL